MKSIHYLTLLSGLALVFPLFGAEVDEAFIPVEVAEAFTGGQIRSELPPGFPTAPFNTAIELRVVGSLEQGVNKVVLVRTPATIDEARSAFREAYSGAGWISLTDSANVLILCHDVLGRMTLNFTETGNGVNRIHVSLLDLPAAASSGGLNCEQVRDNSLSPHASQLAFLQNIIPTLEFPEGALSPQLPGGFTSRSITGIFGVARISLSNGNFETGYEHQFEVPGMDLSDMYAHFARQLIEQGWRVDSNSTGFQSASSVWFKTVDAEGTENEVLNGPLDLIGVMVLIDDGNNSFQLSLNVKGEGELTTFVGGSSFNGAYIDVLGPPLNAPALGIRGIADPTIYPVPYNVLGVGGFPPTVQP